MRKILLIVTLLGLIVAISGCTFNTGDTNKTFSENGVSFTYPGNWEVLNESEVGDAGDNVDVLAVVGIEDEDVFGIANVVPGSDQYILSLSEWSDNVKEDMGSSYVSDKTFTVDEEEGSLISARENGRYDYYLLWIKDGEGYLVYYQSTEESLDKFESIAKTIKTS